MKSNPSFTRPVRGAVRLDALEWDISGIRSDIQRIGPELWKSRACGEKWSDIALYVRGSGNDRHEHAILEDMHALRQVLTGFPAPVVDLCLASLAPGGNIKEHRDISGGTAAGVTRIHIPIVTHEKVVFVVNGRRVFMNAGEVWHLDTTYKHRVSNDSDVTRVHLIIDLETTPALSALLPRPDWRDRLHTLNFWLFCIRKGALLALTRPNQLMRRVQDLLKLMLHKKSALYRPDDVKS